MSNSRKIKRSVRRNVTAVSMAALGTVTVGGLLMTTAGTAFAATPTYAKDALVGTAATVYPGATGQGASDVTLTISNTFTAGDTIIVPIVDPATGAPTDLPTSPDGQTGTVAQAVNYSAVPAVSVQDTTSPASTGAMAPTITATLTTNPNDSAVVKAAGVKDELVLTIGNTAATGVTDQYAITLSGIKYDLGAQAPVNGVYMEPVYEANSVGAGSTPYGFTSSGTPATTTPGTPIENATVQGYSVTQTPTGVAEGAANAAIGNLVMKEVNYGTFAASTATPYTVKPVVTNALGATLAGGATTAGNLTGTATITATGFQVATWSGTACGSPSSSITVTVNSSGQYQFCVTSQTTSTTGPGSITISGMTYTPAAGDTGTVAVEVDDSATTTKKYQTVQPAISIVNVPARVAGYTADDTAVQAASMAASTGVNGTTHAVLLASNAEYQDALSASYLIHTSLPAQTTGGTTVSSTVNPLLLNPYDSTNESATAAGQEIRKLGVGTVYIIGGTDVISQDVQNQLAKTQIGTANGQPVYLQVVRIAGFTAEQTASMVAQYPSAGAGTLTATPGAYGMYNSGASESSTGLASTNPVPTAILVDANEFQDALASSPIASAYSLPVLLNAGGQGLDTSAAAALSNLHVQQVIVVGGSAAVSDQAVTQLESAGYSVLRIAGTTFDATANELAQFELNNYNNATTRVRDGLASPANQIGQTAETALAVGVSRGDSYQDALSSAQLLGTLNSTTSAPVVDPLLLNSGTNAVSAGTTGFLNAWGSQPTGGVTVYSSAASSVESVSTVQVFGGTLAQSASTVQSELNAIAAG